MQLLSTTLLYLPDSPSLRFLPEGPYPRGDHQFSWVAIQHGPESVVGSINVYDWLTKTNVSYELPGRPGFAFSTDQGNFVAGCERTIGIYSPVEGSWKPIAQGIDADRDGTVINDGVTWDGNLIFGTKDLEFKTKKAGLYLWRGIDQKLFRLRDDQICSNGKCILDATDSHVTLLDIDTPTKKVVRYEIDLKLGQILSQQTVVDLVTDQAFPDGMTMTPDRKSIVVSLYNPNPVRMGRTVQYSIATGAVEQTWETERSPQATCPQLILWEGTVWLIITTAVEHMSPERQIESKQAGGLFVAATDFHATPAEMRKLTPVFVEPANL